VSYWQEDRRYPSSDGEHVIVVSKRTDHTGRTYTKTERRKLPKLDRASAEYLRQSYGHAADTAD
jgi:hypothetical protein